MDTSQIRGIGHLISWLLNLTFIFILWVKGRKNKSAFYLGWVALFSSFYTFSFAGVFLFKNKLFWNRATWLGILMLPAYITFLYYFTGRKKYFKLKSFLWYILPVIISFLSLVTPYTIKSVSPDYPYRPMEQGILRPIGRIYIAIASLTGLYYLIEEHSKSQKFRKVQIKYFILGVIIYNVGGLIPAVVIPFLSPGFSGVDIPVFLSIFLVGLTTYAIFKQQLFEIKVILTEILVGLIGVFLSIRFFLDQDVGLKIFNLILLLLFCVSGYLLVKTTYQEIKQRKQAEILAKELKQINEKLEEKVKERTKVLEETLQGVQERKEELERFQTLVIGREMQMVKLKKKIKELEEEKSKYLKENE